ncbi:MAG: PQQ-binding-like beta-propeller repeat protein [Candidatus Bathyarchaeota archaeon]|nr:MAG: PQQ-binding-like beta-propeller repeat protein [Candidatus Bathyarchaeota archaeon]
MKNLNVNSKIATITLVLLLAISAIIVALPAVSAQEQIRTKATVAYIGAMPNPVGVGQPVLLHIGITDYLQSAADGWEDMTVIVTKPDGSVETLGPYRTDSTGGTGDVFVPTMSGIYTLQTHFPEQWAIVTGFFSQYQGNLTYLESYSEELELQVLADPIEYHPGHPKPTFYWDRPIDAQLREWNTISGSWTDNLELLNVYAPYNEGPETAHILWNKELDVFGGLVGGNLGGLSMGTGDAYEGKFPVRYILNGRLYYETGGSRPITKRETVCVDLTTGEEIWRKVFLDNRSISFAQNLYWDGMNYHGGFSYLYANIGSQWNAFDAYTGDWRFTINNIPSGTRLYGPHNEIYILRVNAQNDWMALWSMNDALISTATGYGDGSWGNTIEMKTYDANELSAGWLWNVSIPEDAPGSIVVAGIEDRVILGSSSTKEVTLVGLSLKSGDEGDVLFDETYNAPDYWFDANVTVSGAMGGFVASSLEDGAIVLYIRELREHYGFSTETGRYIWGPTPSEHYLNALEDSPANVRHIAYGKLYSASIGGLVYCYDVLTGDVEWTYQVTDPYSEMLWSNNWWVKPMFITDGKIYVAHTEHSAVDPRPRGAPFVCLDALTGEEIWRIDGAFRTTRWGGRAIIGDSIIVGMDTYDQQIYAIGKGPSALTAQAPSSGVTVGSSAQITGTIMDVSPGTQDISLTTRFPNGVPAISDEDMSAWMLHVYKQFAMPEDIEGVEVILFAIDPSGHYMDISRTISDAYGNWALAFKPEMEGTYQIYATFQGSGAYYGSTTTTYLTVDPAPAVSAPIEPEEPVDVETPVETQEPATSFITTEIAIIAAVAVAAVIGVAAYWFLKRK